MLSFLPVQILVFESQTYLKVKPQKLKCENVGWGLEKLRSFEAQFQSKHITVMRSVLQKHPALHGIQRGAGSALQCCGVSVGPSPPNLALSTLGKFVFSLENVYRSTNQKMLKTFGLSC